MKSDANVDIFFLGDTYFGEWHMDLRAKKGKYNVLAEKGYTHFAKAFEALLADGDLVVANLECAITDIAESPYKDEKRHTYAANEEETIAALKTAHISLLTLANNHSVDFGKAGLVDTLLALEGHGLPYIGGGRNLAEASKPFVFAKQCGDTAFSAALISSYIYTSSSDKWGFYATEKVPGVNKIDASRIAMQTRELKKQGHFIISVPHWGPNYSWRTFEQQLHAEKIIEAGADIIVGHSAHMIQEVEYIDGKLVLYSIGNFIFNGDGEYQRRNLPPYSFIARLHINEDKNGLSCAKMLLYPFVSDNAGTDFNPRFVNKHEFEQVRMIMRSHCYDMNMIDELMHFGRDKFGYYLECPIN